QAARAARPAPRRRLPGRDDRDGGRRPRPALPPRAHDGRADLDDGGGRRAAGRAAPRPRRDEGGGPAHGPRARGLPGPARAQPAPRAVVERLVRGAIPGGENGWTAVGVDEFLRSYLTPRGRAAFYAAARNIYLEEPRGPEGFWTRLPGLEPESLFVWGRRDPL